MSYRQFRHPPRSPVIFFGLALGRFFLPYVYRAITILLFFLSPKGARMSVRVGSWWNGVRITARSPLPLSCGVVRPTPGPCLRKKDRLSGVPRRTLWTSPPCRQLSAAGKNHYTTLGIDRSADVSAIKGAYYKLAKAYHPDVNKSPGASDRFLAVQTAYATLSDESKRRAYDRDHMASSNHSSSSTSSSPYGFRASGFSSPRGPSRPAGYYDPFASFGNADYRSTYTYEDLKRAAQTGSSPSSFYDTEFSDWEDIMDGEDLPPGYDPWEDGAATPGGRDRAGFTSYYGWDDLGDLGSYTSEANYTSKNKKARQEFDAFLNRMARKAGRDPRTENGSFSPDPRGGDKRSANKKRSSKAKAYEHAYGVNFGEGSTSGAHTRAESYTGFARGPDAAAFRAAQSRQSSDVHRKRRGAGGPSYEASVTVTQKMARSGTILKHVPVSLSTGATGDAECAECEGTGQYYPRVKTSKCNRCRGKGFVTRPSTSGQRQRVDCFACSGTGYHAKAPKATECSACDGTGISDDDDDCLDGITVRVKVPARTKDQDVLRVPIGKRAGATTPTARVLVRVAP